MVCEAPRFISSLFTVTSCGSKGAHPKDTPYGPKFSQSYAFFRKFWQNYMLAPPPTGNPGSAPGHKSNGGGGCVKYAHSPLLAFLRSCFHDN